MIKKLVAYALTLATNIKAKLKLVMKVAPDYLVFAWLMLGIGLAWIASILFGKRPQNPAPFDGVLSWTSNFVAPASEKVLDLKTARDMVASHYKHGAVLDVAFGAGRFEESALEPAIEKKAPIDGIDLELEHESSVSEMQKRPWVRKAMKRSYLATGIDSETYGFIFCNNGLMSTNQFPKALEELWRITEDGGTLVFNMTTRTAERWTYAFFIVLNMLLARKDKAREWRARASQRVGTHQSIEELTKTLNDAGWEVIESRQYLSGAYLKWHYLFNFPAYQHFFYYESTGDAPGRYKVMRSIWRPALEHVIKKLLDYGASPAKQGAKVYISARKVAAAKPNHREMSIRPKRAFIDVAYACNLRCAMCDIYSKDAVMEYSHPKPKFMDFELFKRAIDECAPFVESFNIQLRGEPLLHPRYAEMLAYVKQAAPGSKTFFNTNGLLLTDAMTQSIIESGVDGVYISLDATTAEAYDQIRIGSNLKTVTANVENILKRRDESGATFTVGVSFVIQDENENEQLDFLNQWKDKVDYVIYYTKAELDKTRPTLFFEPTATEGVCQAVNENIVILVDGEVVPCCGALGGEVVYGNIQTQSLTEILSAPKAHKFRARLNAMEAQTIPLCSTCTMWVANEVRTNVENGIPVTVCPIQKTYCCSEAVNA